MFKILVYQPLLNILALLTILFKGNLGLAILTLGILIRFCLSPLNRNLLKHQQKLNKIQPQLKELQDKYKDDPQKFLKEMKNLYQKEGIKMSSIFNVMLWQMLLLILFFIFIKQAILNTNWGPDLYSFVKMPENINFTFMNVLNLKEPNLYLLVLYFILTLIPTFLQLKTTNQKIKNIISTFIFLIPIFVLFLSKWQDFSVAVILSWIGMSLVLIIEIFIFKPLKENTIK
ncbi:MAG: YidC/Oxa1 family membrane protein insertase [Minisyncoccia bacterium]